MSIIILVYCQLLMLKITKKQDILSQKVKPKYILQSEAEQKITKAVREASTLSFQDVQQYISNVHSIGAALLAEIIQKILANLQESDIDDSLQLIFKIVALHHDQREFRHYLKHKFRVDAQIFLLILWPRREQNIAFYLVGIILDCYTVQLMLNGKQILKAWKDYINNRINCLQSKEEVQIKLNQLKQQKTHTKQGSLRRLIIPL